MIELSSGHVFAEESVKSIGPLSSWGGRYHFMVYGIGFQVQIGNVSATGGDYEREVISPLREEAIDKLLKVG